MTLIYFIANNNAQAEALYECGVRNVCFDLNFFKRSKLHPMVEFNVLINSGKNKHFTADEYYGTILEWQESFNFTPLQYDGDDIKMNLSYYNMGVSMGVKNLIPIITGDYKVGMNYLTPQLKSDVVALGKGLGNTEEDDDLKKLPRVKYHGLGKFRWLDKKVHSVDTPTWLSLLKNNKTYSLSYNDKIEVQYGTPEFIRACNSNLEYLNRCEVSVIHSHTSKDKLKLPIALYYMPLCEKLGIYEKNFNSRP